MATARMIAKSLSTSERRARLHQEAGPLAEFCQALYPLLVAHADDWGRLEASVFHIKHAIEPTSPRSVEEFTTALLALQTVSLIDWYVVADRYYLQVVDFKKHQPGLKIHGGAKSQIPALDTLARRMMPGDAVDRREMPRDAVLTELNRTELNRTELKNSASAPRLPSENYAVILKIVHEAMDGFGTDSAEIIEEAKRLCAQRKIVYDSPTVQRAFDAARFQRKGKAS